MGPTAVLYVSQAIHGLAYGMLLFLVASGLTMIFGMMGILNVAHASFYMLAGYFCYQVLDMTGNFWLALLIAPVVAGIFGVLVERFLLRPVHAGGASCRTPRVRGAYVRYSGGRQIVLGHRKPGGKDTRGPGRARSFCRPDLPYLSALHYWIVGLGFVNYGPAPL